MFRGTLLNCCNVFIKINPTERPDTQICLFELVVFVTILLNIRTLDTRSRGGRKLLFPFIGCFENLDVFALGLLLREYVINEFFPAGIRLETEPFRI